MSTAELGVSLAEMIRRDKVTPSPARSEHGGRSFKSRRNSKYERIPNYRS